MQVCVVKELNQNESRVAAIPDVVAKMVDMGLQVSVESGAGKKAGFSDDEYQKAGARIAKNYADTVKSADLVLKVNSPFEKIGSKSEIELLPKNSILIGMLDPLFDKDKMQELAKHQLTTFAMEMVPRITRAQAMDVLSSQSNLAGYKAVLDAVHELRVAVPMMMTAAGTIRPAKILILGAGVAGLQAIATAKRLGAVVSAFDVRTAAKEQVESLGASFVEVPQEDDEGGETKGGYAKEMTEEYKRKQGELIAETIKTQDVVITTALIPGRKAPILITDDMVKTMKTGSVIVDMAVSKGGNCESSEPNKIAEKHGVKIVGYENIPARVAKDASMLYSNNILNFLKILIQKDDNDKLQLNLDLGDEIIKNTLITHQGKVVHEMLTESPVKAGAKKRAVKTAAPKKVQSAKKNKSNKVQAAKPATRKAKTVK